jgi:hypothetical protein
VSLYLPDICGGASFVDGRSAGEPEWCVGSNPICPP